MPVALRGYAGPPIDRDFSVGRRPGSDRLQNCPPASSSSSRRDCVASSEEDVNGQSFVAPFVYFFQKGDALGRLLEFLYDDPR